MTKDTKTLVLEISAGIVLYNIVLAILVGIFFREPAVFLGLFLGMVIAIGMIVHMAVSLEKTLALGSESAATKKATVSSVLRSVTVLVILLVILWKFPDRINVLAVVAGAIGLKAGAYLQPVFHKIFH